jgi:hypothetical protein
MIERDNFVAALDAYLKKQIEAHFEVQTSEKPKDAPVSATTTLTKTPLRTKEDIEEAENIIRSLGIPDNAEYRSCQIRITPDQAAIILRANGIDPIGLNLNEIVKKVYDVVIQATSVTLSK